MNIFEAKLVNGGLSFTTTKKFWVYSFGTKLVGVGLLTSFCLTGHFLDKYYIKANCHQFNFNIFETKRCQLQFLPIDNKICSKTYNQLWNGQKLYDS